MQQDDLLNFFSTRIGKANVGQNERSKGQNRGENSAKQRDPQFCLAWLRTKLGMKKHLYGIHSTSDYTWNTKQLKSILEKKFLDNLMCDVE